MSEDYDIIHRFTILSPNGEKQYGIFHPPECIEALIRHDRKPFFMLSRQEQDYVLAMTSAVELLDDIDQEHWSMFDISTISFFTPLSYEKGKDAFEALRKAVESFGYTLKHVQSIRFDPSIIRPLYEDETQVIYERQPYFDAVRQFLINHGIPIEEDLS